MSPRVVPKAQRSALVQRSADPAMGTISLGAVYPPGQAPANPDILSLNRRLEAEHNARARRCTAFAPYVPGCSHSFFRDLLRIGDEERRVEKAVGNAALRGRDPGEPPHHTLLGQGTVQDARRRLGTVTYNSEERDLSSSNAGDALRPSMPGWLADIYGQASRQTGTLAVALDERPLEAGMVDTSSGVPVIAGISRLTSGGAVAIQASQNAAVQETDPATAGISTPIGTLAGQATCLGRCSSFPGPAWTR